MVPRTTRSRARSSVRKKKAEIGYFDGELKSIGFNDGDSIQTLLTKANISFGEGQSINDDEGNEVAVSAQAQDGMTYYIVGNYKQGNI